MDAGELRRLGQAARAGRRRCQRRGRAGGRHRLDQPGPAVRRARAPRSTAGHARWTPRWTSSPITCRSTRSPSTTPTPRASPGLAATTSRPRPAPGAGATGLAATRTTIARPRCTSSPTARLAAAGFGWYEISNWARPGHRSRHNLGYWQGRSWEAVGPGAHAFDGATRRWNAARLDGYVAALAPPDGGAPKLPPGAGQADDAAMRAGQRRDPFAPNQLGPAGRGPRRPDDRARTSLGDRRRPPRAKS